MKRVTKTILVFFLFFGLSPFVFADQNLCCPDGYSNGDFACPFGVDQLKQCCRRNAFASYDVIDKIQCGTTPPPNEDLVCPAGYQNGDLVCPFGTDQTKQCCKRNAFGSYEVVDKIPRGSTPPPNANMCCLSGFSNGDLVCPFGTDQTKQCCRRYGVGSYEVTNKILCGETITGNYACPTGYGTGDFDCPFGVDRTKNCCKRVATGQYDVVHKIQTTLTTPSQPGGSLFSPFCAGGTTEVNTAIGCIPTDFSKLFDKFFKLGIGIAGGIAFLLILFGGFQILTSAGNPERLAAGRELVTSAITGLLMIIFSVFLLQLIGVDILGIPGFTK